MKHEAVQNYYGEVLQGSSDLQTNACCTPDDMPDHLKKILSRVHDEVLTRYYGCGLIAPLDLEGMSILDPTKAKGLVYFSDADNVRSWQHAVEGSGKGKYFGGLDEGPVVAISKPGAGKAAFIGDQTTKTGVYAFGYENNGFMIIPPAALIVVGIIIWVQRSRNRALIEEN